MHHTLSGSVVCCLTTKQQEKEQDPQTKASRLMQQDHPMSFIGGTRRHDFFTPVDFTVGVEQH
eukprot:4565655-Ditylum_brightwellii.AAC.1